MDVFVGVFVVSVCPVEDHVFAENFRDVLEEVVSLSDLWKRLETIFHLQLGHSGAEHSLRVRFARLGLLRLFGRLLGHSLRWTDRSGACLLFVSH